MKNRIIGLIIITALTAGVLTGCGQSSGTVSKDKNSEQHSEIEKELEPIRVGAGVTPHAEILREIHFLSAKSDKLFSVKKMQCSFRGYTTHEYELSNHLVCLDNLYYPNAYAVWAFVVIAPYWEGGR